MEAFGENPPDLLVAAFLCMEPPKLVVSLAREVGGGILSEFAQQFFLENCFNNEVHIRYPASQAYLHRVVKQIILAAENDGQEVRDDLYDLHSVLLVKDKGRPFTERCYKTFTFMIPEKARVKLRDILGDAASSEVMKRRMLTTRVSLNLLDGDTGYCVWPAGLFLAEVLLSHPQLVHGKSCLELGSGTGICGIWLTMLAPYKAVLTDGALSSLVNLRHNLAINGIAVQKEDDGILARKDGTTSLEPECRQLVWELVSEEELQAIKPEVIIGGDLMYDPTLVPGLVRVLGIVLHGKPVAEQNHNGHQQFDQAGTLKSLQNEVVGSVAYLSMALRNLTTRDLFFELAANAGLEVIDVTEIFKPMEILPEVQLLDRAHIRLYKVISS